VLVVHELRLPKLKKYDLIKVTWLDSFETGSPYWKDEYEVDIETGATVESIGYYLDHGKKWLAVCSGHFEEMVMGLFYIPVGCIESLDVLETTRNPPVPHRSSRSFLPPFCGAAVVDF